jgi:hypothetical protein
MSKNKTSFLWIAILAVACMFIAGQAWAQCTDPGPDADGDGIPDDADICPTDATNQCDAGVVVAPGQCDTYKGLHPLTKDALDCCSGGATPECASGVTGDQVCYVEYEFCANGTVTKTWDADPNEPLATHGAETGTWGYVTNQNGGEDLVIHVQKGGLFTQTTDEVHGIAVTYMDGGTRVLDWNGTIQLDTGTLTPGDGSVLIPGMTYVGIDAMDVVVSGGILDLHADISRMVELTDAGGGMLNWEQTVTTNQTCAGSFCPGAPGPVVTNGTIANDPGELKNIVDTFYFLVVDDTLAMRKQ